MKIKKHIQILLFSALTMLFGCDFSMVGEDVTIADKILKDAYANPRKISN
jgi:hypothetical protein